MDACNNHSKVLTSKGVRDRRIRLSPETASKFFELHHRLGFDQPSKSVEWLLKQSQSAIDGLPELFHFQDYLHNLGTGVVDESDLINPCFDASYFGLEWEDGNQWSFCSIDKLQGTQYLCSGEKQSDNQALPRTLSEKGSRESTHSNLYVEQSRDSGLITARPVGLINPKETLERRAKARERARQRTKEKNNSK